jgi:parallel beta-helix repeat protein
MSAKLRLLAAPTALGTLAGLLASTMVGFLALSGALAAGEPKCGDTITADTTLHKDLVNCPNNGIVIGADGVTLNLNGHTIDGDGKAFAACPRRKICDVGVVTVGHDGVALVGGSVREFDYGALVGNARHNRLLGVSSSRNRFFGFAVFNSARSLVRDSSGSANLAPDGDGMGLFGSHDIRILHNTFRHNSGPGIHIDESTDNLIQGNLISRNSPGILVEADRNQVRRNRFVRGTVAGVLVATGRKNVIARNRFSRNGDGIAIEKGGGNLVERNVIVDARKAGVYLGLDQPPIGGVDNVVRRNVVRGSGGDGFLVRRKDNHSVLKGNLAVGAGDDGFDVQSRTTKLTGNRALRNRDLGIEAVRGAIDGGGNRASGNGDARQCVHVGCH